MKYSIHINECTNEQWRCRAAEFADYSIYQTIPYQENRAAADQQDLLRTVVTDTAGSICLMSLVRVKRSAVGDFRVGYVQAGPLLRRLDGRFCCDPDAFRIWREALHKSGLNVVRIVPPLFAEEESDGASLFQAAGFKLASSVVPYRTFLVDVRDSEEGIRGRLRKSFRRDLRKAEQGAVEIRTGGDESLFSILAELYAESKERKGFAGLEIEEFSRPQGALAQEERLTVSVAFVEEQPAAALLSSELGDTSLVLLAAANDQGLQSGASYVLWYNACLLAHRKGLQFCDLGGVDPDQNPGVYRFKSRLGGAEKCRVGGFDSCQSVGSRLLWKTAQKAARFVAMF